MPPTKKELQELREKLSRLMSTLRNNKANVPLEILKTKYKKGFDALCNELSKTATSYAILLMFSGIPINQNYIKEWYHQGETMIDESGILNQLSKDVFKSQDIAAFEEHCMEFRNNFIEKWRLYESNLQQEAS